MFMTKLIEQTARFPQEEIEIDEYFGRISSGDDGMSWCRIRCVAGWSEPFQQPDFDEYMVVLRGCLHIRHEGSSPATIVRAGQAAMVLRGERISYATPDEDTEYFAVCLPAFTMERAGRDET